jgi:octaprenyl-diphosphate synthase
MSSIDKIRQPISEELKQFDLYFKDVMKTEMPLLNLIMKYLLNRKGKQMRPVLVFLTAKLFGNPTDSTFTAAALIEMLHTATLIHDDVVDESNERRGFFSISAIWKSKIAVLIGDYLLAKGLLLAIGKKEYDILSLVSDAVKEMSEGELLQIKNSRKLKITEDEYFEIIRKKTATLIACCSASGAKSVGAEPELVNKMKKFGELLGIAFQIKDDLLDYQINSLTGKPKGNDIQEKKLTLPLIHAIEASQYGDRTRILRIMNNTDKGHRKFTEILSFINRFEGIQYAEHKMNEYAQRAKEEIQSFNNNEINAALTGFVDYAILRNK